MALSVAGRPAAPAWLGAIAAPPAARPGMGVDLSLATPLPQPRCLAASALDGLPQWKDHTVRLNLRMALFLRPEARLNSSTRKPSATGFQTIMLQLSSAAFPPKRAC